VGMAAMGQWPQPQLSLPENAQLDLSVSQPNQGWNTQTLPQQQPQQQPWLHAPRSPESFGKNASTLSGRSHAERWELNRRELKIQEKIGEGQGGHVYKCRWRGLDCTAKMLSRDMGPRELGDLANEIEILSSLRHPNLVLFLGACTDPDGELIFLNEFCAGGNLEDLFAAKEAKRGPWRPPVKTALNWCIDLARALCFLHNCNPCVIHRDVKPANLLLSEDMHIKLSDFGISCLMVGTESGKPRPMTGNTGTKRYMAPEVFRCEPNYDAKVDIYSMAMIFWLICMGTRPFGWLKPDEVAVRANSGTRPDLATIRTQAGTQLSSLIERCWAGDPQLRPTAEAVVDELDELRQKYLKKSKGCECM